jgi:hypothetical protein
MKKNFNIFDSKCDKVLKIMAKKLINSFKNDLKTFEINS